MAAQGTTPSTSSQLGADMPSSPSLATTLTAVSALIDTKLCQANTVPGATSSAASTPNPAPTLATQGTYQMYVRYHTGNLREAQRNRQQAVSYQRSSYREQATKLTTSSPLRI